MLSILVLAALSAVSRSCQEIRLAAADESIVLGRSMEFSMPFDTYFYSEPEGMEETYPELANCPGYAQTFANRFKMFTIKGMMGDHEFKATLGGMNAAGLSASSLYMPGFAEYKDASDLTGEECRKAIPHTKVAHHVLSQFASVAELVDAWENDELPEVYYELDLPMGGENPDGIVHPVHWSFQDKTGAGLVVEYTNGGMFMAHWNTVGVLTNSPKYDWHMENLRMLPNMQREGHEMFKYRDAQGESYKVKAAGAGSGTLGLPGDYTSQSRFLKAATLLTLSKKPKNVNDAIMTAFHLLNAADITEGVIGQSEHHEDEYSNMEDEDQEEMRRMRRAAGAKKGKKGKGKKNKQTGEEVSDNSNSREEPANDGFDYTYWVVVKDLTRGCMYYRGYFDMGIRKICLDDTPDELSRIMLGNKFKNTSWKDESNNFENVEN